MSAGWLQVAQETLKIPGLLIDIYGDLARPGVRQVGKALETVVGLGNTILWPIALANERSRLSLEKNLERYRKQLESVPEEKICGVAPEIGVPVAEKLAYVGDEHLSELYIKLLATASNVDTLKDAHPSFVNVINNLSPDEAQLLEYFVKQANLPFLKAIATVPANGNHSVLKSIITPDNVISKLVYPDNIDAYFSNLEGLGLINIRDEAWLSDDNTYEVLENQYRPNYEIVMQSNLQFTDRKLEFKKGIIQRTSFGLKFVRACHAV